VNQETVKIRKEEQRLNNSINYLNKSFDNIEKFKQNITENKGFLKDFWQNNKIVTFFKRKKKSFRNGFSMGNSLIISH